MTKIPSWLSPAAKFIDYQFGGLVVVGPFTILFFFFKYLQIQPTQLVSISRSLVLKGSIHYSIPGPFTIFILPTLT